MLSTRQAGLPLWGSSCPDAISCACLQTVAAVLEMCNALVIKSAGALETLCMVGVLHLAARYASPSWPKPVRLQAALFLQAACTHSPATAQMLIACQVGSAGSIGQSAQLLEQVQHMTG